MKFVLNIYICMYIYMYVYMYVVAIYIYIATTWEIIYDVYKRKRVSILIL